MKKEIYVTGTKAKGCTYWAVAILAVLMTFMEMSGLPSALFIHISVLDIDPVYFTLMINFVIAGVICLVWRRFVCKDWRFELTHRGLSDGLKLYLPLAVIATILPLCAFFYGLQPFNYTPTIWKVIIEGFVYNIGVGIIEEIYLRGLLQNLLEHMFSKSKHSALWAILITSVLFGLGHIASAPGQPLGVIIAKVVWATALGVYFGSAYVRTRNLWVPIILHALLNFEGVPFCFTQVMTYPMIGVIVCLITYLLLAAFGLYTLTKTDHSSQSGGL